LGTYAITVSNVGTAPTNGTVQVVDTVPSGMTLTSAAGTGWTCGTNLQVATCSRNDSLAASSAYPPIAVTVLVAPNAPPSLTNTAVVSGGGEINTSNDTANDTTTINQVPVVSFSSSSIDFGNVYLGSTNVSMKTTLSNLGNAPLSLGTIKITPNTGEDQFFTVGSNCPRPLPSGSSCMITVTFKPNTSQLGANSAFVSVTDNAAGSPQTVALTANVIDPEVALSTDAINFGRQKVGTTSVPQTFTVTNEGQTALSIYSIVASAFNGSSDFGVIDLNASACSSTLNPGSTCQISVTYTPSKLGSLNGAVTITDNAKKSTQKVTLQGIGISN